jgi:hypothetical protein
VRLQNLIDNDVMMRKSGTCPVSPNRVERSVTRFTFYGAGLMICYGVTACLDGAAA